MNSINLINFNNIKIMFIKIFLMMNLELLVSCVVKVVQIYKNRLPKVSLIKS